MLVVGGLRYGRGLALKRGKKNNLSFFPPQTFNHSSIAKSKQNRPRQVVDKRKNRYLSHRHLTVDDLHEEIDKMSFTDKQIYSHYQALEKIKRLILMLRCQRILIASVNCRAVCLSIPLGFFGLAYFLSNASIIELDSTKVIAKIHGKSGSPSSMASLLKSRGNVCSQEFWERGFPLMK